jgi:hypothetical protein
MLSIDRLGLVMAWFGPMSALSWKKPKVNFLDRILSVLKYGWFFGDIEREEWVLKKNQAPGTCKLRGQHEPNLTLISKVKNQKIEYMSLDISSK